LVDQCLKRFHKLLRKKLQLSLSPSLQQVFLTLPLLIQSLLELNLIFSLLPSPNFKHRRYL
jgi:hypothetical protein